MKVSDPVLNQEVFKHYRKYAYSSWMMALDSNSNCYTAINLKRDGYKTTTTISDGYWSGPSLHTVTHETPTISHIQYLDSRAYWHYTCAGLVRSDYDGGRDVVVVAGQFTYACFGFYSVSECAYAKFAGYLNDQVKNIDRHAEYFSNELHAFKVVKSRGLVFVTKRAGSISQNYVFRVIKPSNMTSGFNISKHHCSLPPSFDMPLESITKLNRNYLATSSRVDKRRCLVLLGHRFDVVEYRK